MKPEPTASRRNVLETFAAAGLAAGAAGTASAGEGDESGGGDGLDLVGEAVVENAHEVVADEQYAYVATGDGMAIVNLKKPSKPKVVSRIEASDPEDIGGDDRGTVGGVLDVKVDGDLAVMAHNGGTGITTVDVSDRHNPQELAFYNTLDDTGVHNAFLSDGVAYLTVSADRWVEDEEGGGVRIFGNTGAEIVDVSDPENPERAATWYLREELPDYANAGVNPNHDLYEQDGLLYNAFWDAGVVVLDVSDPTDPDFVAQFGAAEQGDEVIRPWRPTEETREEYFDEVFPLDRYYAGDGNAHYVQPAPDGDHVYVGDEKFPNRLMEDPDDEDFGGIRVFDTSDLDDAEQVGYISPPSGDRLRTSHNFDVTENRLHTSWYHGGVRLYDITDPSDPDEIGVYNPEGQAFWTAVESRGFTLGGIYGARSDDHEGGVAVLQSDG